MSISSFETAIIIEAFGAILRRNINGDVKDLVVVVIMVVVVVMAH